ncbi:hypothetical protein D3C81_1549350 [compost metagenome]
MVARQFTPHHAFHLARRRLGAHIFVFATRAGGPVVLAHIGRHHELSQLRIGFEEAAVGPQLGAHLPVLRRRLAGPDDLADLLVFQQEGVAEGKKSVRAARRHGRRARLRIEVEDFHIAQAHAIGFQQSRERVFPRPAPVQGDLPAFQVLDRFRCGTVRHHQVGIVGAAARQNQPRLQARGIGDNRRQVAILGQVDRVVGKRLVDLCRHRIGGDRHPFQLHAQLAQLGRQPAL